MIKNAPLLIYRYNSSHFKLFIYEYVKASISSVLLLNTQKKYLVRVLLNFFLKVFSTSTLRGVIQKYLVRVLNSF